MIKRISAREARNRFADLAGSVHYSREPVIVERKGRPFVAVISAEDLEEFETFRRQQRQERFAQLAQEAGREAQKQGLSLEEEAIVAKGKEVREEVFKEMYGQQ